MRLFGFLNSKSEIARALCISVLFHLALLGILIFGAKNITLTPPALAGMNLVWVSLGTDTEQNKNGRASRSVSFANSQHTTSEEKISPCIVLRRQSMLRLNRFTTGKYLPGTILAELAVESPRQAGPAGDRMASAFTAYPVYGENMPPVYPEIARIRGYEGVMLIAAEILSNGRVGEARISKSSGYSILDQAALEAIKPWRFEPAKNQGGLYHVGGSTRKICPEKQKNIFIRKLRNI